MLGQLDIKSKPLPLWHIWFEEILKNKRKRGEEKKEIREEEVKPNKEIKIDHLFHLFSLSLSQFHSSSLLTFLPTKHVLN